MSRQSNPGAFPLDETAENASWDEMFQRLRKHKIKTGSCNVKRYADPALAAWVSEQRGMINKLRKKNPSSSCYKSSGKSAISDESSTARVTKLIELGLGKDRNEENKAVWDLRLKELLEYKDTHSDCLVPARYRENPQLGHWVMAQRRQYALLMQGKPSTLTKERFTRLERIDFTWATREESKHAWNKRLKELKEYKARHGDCLVPQRYAENPKLGTWVNTQRRHYKLLQEGKHSSMTPERITLLEEIGFSWSSPRTGSLASQLESLRKSKKNKDEVKTSFARAIKNADFASSNRRHQQDISEFHPLERFWTGGSTEQKAYPAFLAHELQETAHSRWTAPPDVDSFGSHSDQQGSSLPTHSQLSRHPGSHSQLIFPFHFSEDNVMGHQSREKLTPLFVPSQDASFCETSSYFCEKDTSFGVLFR